MLYTCEAKHQSLNRRQLPLGALTMFASLKSFENCTSGLCELDRFRNRWFAGAIWRADPPPSVRLSAEMSFRSAKDVPAKV